MKKSLSFRFSIWAISIMTLILVGFGVFDYRSVSHELNKRLNSDLQVLEESLIETIPASLWNFELGQVSRTLQSSIKNSSVVGLLVVENENVVSGFIQSESGEISETKEITNLGEAVQKIDLNHTEDGTVSKVGELYIHKNLYYIESQQKLAINKIILQILVLDILVALSLHILISHLVKNPLENVSNALRDISTGGGDLTQRLRIKRNDEIGLLAEYFNTFVAKIQSSMQLVDISSRELENTVNTVKSNETVEKP